jgi:hypothetical protein
LEKKMEDGQFIVVDATHAKVADIKKYKKYVDKYRYRTFCLNFDVSPEVAKERNLMRAEYKQVPEFVIDNFHQSIQEGTPSWVTDVYSAAELFSRVEYQTQDFSQYRKIHHIGDIHGCVEPVTEYFTDNPIQDDELYIFVGDFVDRGVNNAEVLEFMFEIMDLPNVIMLEGNHEIHLWKWAKGELSRSREFNESTRPELEEKGVSQKLVRELYRRLYQCVYYTYGSKKVLVTHAGLSTVPYPSEDLCYVPTKQLIKGVGTYTNIPYEAFEATTDEDTYQIHGHRNRNSFSIHPTDSCFNLEGKVEFGGHLRIVTLDEDGFDTVEVLNNRFKQGGRTLSGPKEHNNFAFLAELRSNPDIHEATQEDSNISAFNFVDDVFFDAKWDSQNIKARGLFVNTETSEIVARSYNKFFNVGEREGTSMEELLEKFVYPVRCSLKYNGFLGIVGYDSASDEMFVSSKGSSSSDYAGYFWNLLDKNLSHDQASYLKSYVKRENVSLVFEVIDPTNDPHIIEYDEPHVVLLDVVQRSVEYAKLPPAPVEWLAEELGFPCREIVQTFEDRESLESFVNSEDTQRGYYNGEPVEGFVFEDFSSYMVKLKLSYYSKWKAVRSLVARHANQRPCKGHYAFQYEGVSKFYEWLKAKPLSYVEFNIENVIELRNSFEKETEE